MFFGNRYCIFVFFVFSMVFVGVVRVIIGKDEAVFRERDGRIGGSR